MVARAAGAGRLIAIDTSDYARKNALQLGATHAIDGAGAGAKEKVYQILPDGPDLVVEAAGPIDAVKLMVDLRRRGTKWNVFGITTHEKFELDGGLTQFPRRSHGCQLRNHAAGDAKSDPPDGVRPGKTPRRSSRIALRSRTFTRLLRRWASPSETR